MQRIARCTLAKEKEIYIMKKWLFRVLPTVMLLCLLVGCGAEPNGKEKAETSKTEEKGVTDGYWVVEKMVMEGMEFEGEEMKNCFGEAESILAMVFNEDGSYDGVYMDEFIKGTYSDNNGTLELEMLELKGKGECSSEQLVLTLDDKYVYTMKKQTEMPASIKQNPWITYAPNFDSNETSAMSSFMAGGWYIVKDDVLYGLTHVNDNQPKLGATPFGMKGDFPEFEETKVLDENGCVNYMQMEGDYLYYIRDYKEICCVKIDGSDAKTLYTGDCDYLQIYDGRLYFTDAEYHFVSTDMDGQDLKTVVDKEIYYPYFICKDWLVFQDDADNESLHLYNVTVGEEFNLTNMPAYKPILDGTYLYYMSGQEDAYNLCRMDISNPDSLKEERSDKLLLSSEYMIDDQDIYVVNNTAREKEQWKEITTTGDAVTMTQVYVSEGYTISHEFDQDGLITRKSLMSKERLGGTSFK